MSEAGDNILVFAAMRNEGAFLVEWVAWYRMLGFRILIAHNDSTDHSAQLMQALAEAGWLRHFEHRPRPGQPPKASAHRALMRREEFTAADWMLICDVDEFLVLHETEDIQGHIARFGGEIGGLAFHWRCFGTSGHSRYADGLVHRQFTRCGPPDMRPNIMFKTLTRLPRRFRRFSDHGPVMPRSGDWSDPDLAILDASGRAIGKFAAGPHPVRFTPPEGITHERAQMNHYVIRSDESFDLKRGTPSASAMKDRYTERFYRGRNVNTHEDTSALRVSPRFEAVHAEAMALPGVRRLHHLCCADYVARLAEAAGKRAEDDPRWQSHMEEARSQHQK